MDSYFNSFQVTWSDLDPNRHLRHTAYNDFAAQVRVNFISEHGFSFQEMGKLQVGPILFREETRFFREIGFNEIIKINIQLASASDDGAKWAMLHQIFRADGELSATVLVEGAWMDLRLRKITAPPGDLKDVVMKMPKTEDFKYIPRGSATKT